MNNKTYDEKCELNGNEYCRASYGNEFTRKKGMQFSHGPTLRIARISSIALPQKIREVESTSRV